MKTLKAWMDKNGVTQAQLGERVGVNQNTVSQWIAGKRSPAVTVILKLSKATGIEPSLLVVDSVRASVRQRKLTREGRRA
jgi:transcriptional regulator with XRE-family HTH domain